VNFSYLMRLLCLCLASFFLLHLALGLLVSLTASWLIRTALRMEARLAARLLLALRLLPAGLAALVVVGICMPSYLWLEPGASAEQVGWACLAAALLGLTVLGVSGARTWGAYHRSRRYIRQCESRGRKIRLGAEPMPVFVVTGVDPLVALTGVFRQRLMISQLVKRTLSPQQLTAVLRHERAHGMSRDNLKRLAILLSPGLLPFFRGFGGMERAWAVAAEWAADDRATAGNRRRALSLASALVSVARLHEAQLSWHRSPPIPTLLATSLLADCAGLGARVDRLFRPVPYPSLRRAEIRSSAILKAAAGLTLAAGAASMMLLPAILHAVHELLEDLIR
jgi:hypothetical protein